jgi:hypothetical protein
MAVRSQGYMAELIHTQVWLAHTQVRFPRVRFWDLRGLPGCPHVPTLVEGTLKEGEVGEDWTTLPSLVWTGLSQSCITWPGWLSLVS